jgi:hypothetical protein
MKAGFLHEATVTEAVSPAALAAQYTEALRESERLRAIVEPDSEPFRSRYEERSLLRRLSQQANANAAAAAKGSEEGDRARFIAAAATAMLGANFMDTEETGQARTLLDKSLPVLSAAAEADTLAIETLNRLGVLAANREEHPLSLELLQRALQHYESACQAVLARVGSLPPAAAAAAAGLLEAGQAEADAAGREARALEDLHTLTGFYLAQAYGNCGQPAESAHWCLRTMRRQLRARGSGRADEHGFKPHEWARNAASLSSYFCAEKHFAAAQSCLHAADAVLRANRRSEKARVEAAAAAEAVAASQAAAGAVEFLAVTQAGDGAAETPTVQEAGARQTGAAAEATRFSHAEEHCGSDGSGEKGSGAAGEGGAEAGAVGEGRGAMAAGEGEEAAARADASRLSAPAARPRNYMTRIGAATVEASQLNAGASTPGESDEAAQGVSSGAGAAQTEDATQAVGCGASATQPISGGARAVLVSGGTEATPTMSGEAGATRPVTLSGTQIAEPAAGDAMAAAAAAAHLPEEELEVAAHLDIAFVQFWLALLHAIVSADAPRPDAPTVDFPGLALPKPHPATALGAGARTPDAAREVYRLGAAHAARAKAILVLDGFVTDHFAILSLESSLLGALLALEPQPGRRMAMHRRRIELLHPPLQELNENAYVQIYRQTLYDVASIRSDMLELRASQLQDEPEPRRAAALAPLVTDAVAAHAEFLRRFEKDGAPPSSVDEESAQAYISSRLSLARAHSKLATLPAMADALAQYKIVSAFLNANAVPGLEGEAKVCDEMIELLPMRMAHLSREAGQGASR